MVEFMVSNNLLCDYQFGFVKGRSTTLQLLNVLNDWTNSLENKFTTDCIYLDYQKAFRFRTTQKINFKITVI